VPVRARERRDRERREDPLAVAEASDRAVVDGGEGGEPLRQQRARRHETQARRAGGRDGGERDVRLAAAGRKRDQAAAPGQTPGGERRVLIGAELQVRAAGAGRTEG